MIEKLCRNCFQSFNQFTSMQNICGKCTYNRMMSLRYSSRAKAKPKLIKRVGKTAKKWLEARQAWIETNPPGHDGTWTCYLNISPMCQKTMNIDYLTLDHRQSRSRHPELRYDLDNLSPACYPCNSMKGSLSDSEVMHSSE